MDIWGPSASLFVIATDFDSSPAFAAANARQDSSDQSNADCRLRGVDISYALDPQEEVFVEIVGSERQHPHADAASSAPPTELPPSQSGASRRRSTKRQASAVAKKLVKGPYKARLFSVMTSSARFHTTFTRVATRLDARTLPHAGRGSWIGSRAEQLSRTPWTLDCLLNEKGFRLVKYVAGQSAIFTDKNDRVVGGLLDKPLDSGWQDAVDEAARSLRSARRIRVGNGTFSDADFHDRRGDFLKIPVGISTGGGQKARPPTLPANVADPPPHQCPSNLFHHIKARRVIARSILRNQAIQRIAGAQSAGFAFLNPKLFNMYCRVIGQLHDRHSHLHTNFSNSIFPAGSFNCGPESVSLDHFDYNNLSFGFCALTPMGEFDYTLGGHLVLFELGLVVEFPPGTIALIPSAAIRHANTPIQPGEERMSIAQYAAGGIFRWVAYGFRSGKTYDASAAGRLEKAALNKGDDVRWAEGLDLYSTSASLRRDQGLLF